MKRKMYLYIFTRSGTGAPRGRYRRPIDTPVARQRSCCKINNQKRAWPRANLLSYFITRVNILDRYYWIIYSQQRPYSVYQCFLISNSKSC